MSVTVTGCLAAVPLFLSDHTQSGLCLFHMFTPQTHAMFLYSMTIHLGVNVAILIVGLLLFAKLVMVIHSSDKIMKSCTTGRRQHNKSLLVLMIQMACRWLCWFPLQMALIALLSGADIGPDAVRYLMLMGFSLNLLINPFLYTIRSMRNM